MTTSSDELMKFLRDTRDAFDTWTSLALLADVGTPMRGLPRLPRGVRRRRLGRCFGNAFQLAMRSGWEYGYVEGYAARADLGVPMEHAWNVDRDGRVVDATWHDTAETNAYVGVVIPEKDAQIELVRLRHYGILFTYRGPNVELMRRLWPHALPAHIRGEKR